MGSFSADISKFIQKTGLKADTVVRKLAFDGLQSVIMRSPVDTGRFRASWRVGLGDTNLSVEPPQDSLQYGTRATDTEKAESALGLTYEKVTTGEAQTQTQKAVFGQTIVISNNVPYAPDLENGHSKQAPNGVLATAFLELTTNFAAIVASIK